MSKEIWKPITNYKGYYEVSNLGRVKTLPRKVKNGSGYRTLNERYITGHKPDNDYQTIILSKNRKTKTFRVHNLVAKAFLKYKKGLWVNHIDGNKTNNILNNLEFCTPGENMIHAFDLGLRKDFGENNHKSKLKNQEVLEIVKLFKTNISNVDIGKKYNVACSTISQIRCGINWSRITGIKRSKK